MELLMSVVWHRIQCFKSHHSLWPLYFNFVTSFWNALNHTKLHTPLLRGITDYGLIQNSMLYKLFDAFYATTSSLVPSSFNVSTPHLFSIEFFQQELMTSACNAFESPKLLHGVLFFYTEFNFVQNLHRIQNITLYLVPPSCNELPQHLTHSQSSSSRKN